jgi:hypothetical protein
MRLSYLKIIAFCSLIFAIVAACTSKKKEKFDIVPGYNLANPTILNLKSELDEISGICYYPKDTSIFAITDEAGLLYKIFVRKKVEIEKWKFSTKGDFEDLVLVDSVFYALNSNGAVTNFRFSEKDSFQTDRCEPPFTGKNEFESMYYDLYNNQLVVLCKDCEADKKNALTAYAFNPGTRKFADTPFYVMDVNKIAAKLGLEKMKFKPSAAAIHPITKELYIISSVNKALVIADREGKVIDAYSIDPKLFKQPEGITFTPSGDMLISNEAAEVGLPNILIFKYKELINEKG